MELILFIFLKQKRSNKFKYTKFDGIYRVVEKSVLEKGTRKIMFIGSEEK